MAAMATRSIVEQFLVVGVGSLGIYLTADAVNDSVMFDKCKR